MKPLTKRTVVAYLRFLLGLMLLLFGSAGTLWYWQAWLYLAVFIGSGAIMTSYFLRHDPGLIERRLEAGPQAEKEPSQKVIMSFAAGLVLLVFIVPGLDHRFQWSEVPPMAVWLANAVVALGMWVVFRVFQANGFAASTITISGGQKVISSGPYGWVRHPMYSGSALSFLAAPIALGSWWALIPALLACAAIVVRLLYEEDFLLDRLPGYRAYRLKVRWRLVPWFW